MDWHDTALAQVASPVLIGVLVVDPVLQVVWKQVLEFNGRPQLHMNLRVLARLG
jgi:hypothetical protein